MMMMEKGSDMFLLKVGAIINELVNETGLHLPISLGMLEMMKENSSDMCLFKVTGIINLVRRNRICICT